jgi:hypothetical protein
MCGLHSILILALSYVVLMTIICGGIVLRGRRLTQQLWPGAA